MMWLATSALIVAFLAPIRPPELRRCTAPIASNRISDSHRKHALEKQEQQLAEAERATRAAREQKLNILRASRDTLKACESDEPRSAARVVHSELHQLEKQDIELDVPCIESAARTFARARRWGDAADLASEVRSAGLQLSEPQAAGALVEALARRGQLTACLALISDADGANLRLEPKALEPALSTAAAERNWEAVLNLHRRIDPPSRQREPASSQPEMLVAVISAHGHLGEWREAVRVAAKSARGSESVYALWAATAEACAESSASSAAAARTARRLHTYCPVPEVAYAAIRALAAASLWADAARVAVALLDEHSDVCFVDAPDAWTAAVHAAVVLDDESLALRLARCRREGADREAHAAVMAACAMNDELDLAVAHLPHARPFSDLADERCWLLAILTANKTGQSALAMAIFTEMSDLDGIRDDVLQRALGISVDAAALEGMPTEALRMLTDAGARAPSSLWLRALMASLDAGEARPVYAALVSGAASPLAKTEAGKKVLAAAASALLEGMLAPIVSKLAIGVVSESQVLNLVQTMCIGVRSAEMAKRSIASARSGGSPLVSPNFNGLRLACSSLGCHVSGVHDVDESCSWAVAVDAGGVPKRSEVIIDILSFIGIEDTPELRRMVPGVVRSSSKLTRGIQRAAQATSKEERLAIAAEVATIASKKVEELGKPVTVASVVDESDIRVLQQESDGIVQQLIATFGNGWPSAATLDAVLVLLLIDVCLFRSAGDPTRFVLDSLVDSEPSSVSGYIAALALLEKFCRQAKQGERDDEFAARFLDASDLLVSFLERNRQVGTAEERSLAYLMLAHLLRRRQEVQSGALWGDLIQIEQAEPLLRVMRMAAGEPFPPTPQLLSQLLAGGHSFTAGDVNATMHAFVEAGGQPTGDQLVYASLCALGVSFAMGAEGSVVSSFYRGPTVRAAWFELKAIWQLALRARDGLWPQLRAAGASESEILTPIQDIILHGALAHLQFAAVAPSDYDYNEVKSEVHNVMLEMGIPQKKVEAMLHGDSTEVLGRISTQMTIAHSSWLAEGGWNVELRMFAPVLTRIITSLNDVASAIDIAGARIENGKWVYDGTIAPRLHRGLMQPESEDGIWAYQLFGELTQSAAMIKLLERALTSLERAEPLDFDGKDKRLAQKAQTLLGLDVSDLNSWDADQQADLTTGLSYIKAALNAQKIEIEQSKWTALPRATNKRGFGGGAPAAKGAGGGKARKKKGGR